MDIKRRLAEEFSVSYEHSSNVVDLIEQGNTIPFIARYRKEMHGAMDDQLLRSFSERLEYLQSLEKRKEEIKASIEGQGKWTDDLAKALDAAKTLAEAEDIYRPYKQKKKTRASIAKERGLEPLAATILAQELKECNLDELCAPFITEEVPDTESAVNGALDIIAETISDDAAVRKSIREFILESGMIKSEMGKEEDEAKKAVYSTYFKYEEKIKTAPSHRILALNRGEKEECLKVAITCDDEHCLNSIRALYKKSSAFDALIERAIADSYERLIFPSVEREVRATLTESADEQAIKMFELNLKPLLMQPPLKGKTIIGLDPAYRTGCKIAVIDASGNLLEHTVIYPTPPQKRVEDAERVMIELINKYNVDCISIGNGTASKESEIFVAELIKKVERTVTYAVVNEAGASVYSAGKLAAEEFPDVDLTVRSAASIARRLLDPLSELIKIDVKSIGVGQYQHDMPQRRLTDALNGVVENCVNSVGVNLNTASYALLAFVAGLNLAVAKNIVEYRKKARFSSRDQLKSVPRLGDKAFEQCAGFLRIVDGENVLDNTAVHPESYEAAKKLLQTFGYTDADVVSASLGELRSKAEAFGMDKLAATLGIGTLTLSDIIDELQKPGRDIRDELPAPILRSDVMDLNDLTVGMELTGTVRNVIDFGAFVDIGVHQDGLVHISEICDRYIKHPSEVLKVGDTVKCRVLSVDPVKKRIALSLRSDKPRENSEGAGKAAANERRERSDRNENRNDRNRNRNDNRSRDNRGQRNFKPRTETREYRDGAKSQEYVDPNETLEQKLARLQNKFKK